MERSKLKIIGIIWILIGVLSIYFTIDILNSYSSSFHVFMFSNEVLSKSIIFGLVYILIGVFILKTPFKLTFELYSLIVWIISFSTLWILVNLVSFSKLELEYLLISDYLIIFLIWASISTLKEEGQIEKSSSFKKILSSNYKRLISELLIINMAIYFLSIIFNTNS